MKKYVIDEAKPIEMDQAYEPIFKTKVEPLRLTRLPLFLVSISTFEPGNYISKLAALDMVPIDRQQFRFFTSMISSRKYDIDDKVLICMADLATPETEANRRSCLAFRSPDEIWEMPIFCTYHSYFYSCNRSQRDGKEHRWVIVQRVLATY